MQRDHLKRLIAFGAAQADKDPFAGAINAATEADFVSARFLKQELESAGYEIKETPRNVLTRVEVFKDEARLAYGESDSAGDALLHAMLGYVRESPAAA